MKDTKITNDIIYVGADDKDLDLFEGQYIVPNGVSYNSYIILDEKIAIMDTVDPRKTDEWFANIKEVLGDKTPDYLVVHHVEPDHAGSIKIILEHYPDIKIVGNQKTFVFINQFFEQPIKEEIKVLVKEGSTLNLGKHTLKFIMAPMVHWPEVMVSYESSEKVLFSADAFGKFGTLDTDEAWTCEARRYYINIVGKYGVQVQQLLKKASNLDIKTICPLHGPILKEDLGYYINKYDIWSSYKPEDEGIVIVCGSIHGNTLKACEKFAEILKEKGATKVSIFDLTRDDMAEATEDAFRYNKLVLASVTYENGLFGGMESFLHHLKSKNFQNRTVAYIENGSWAVVSGKFMKEIVSGMKNIKEIEPTITIKSSLKTANLEQMNILADELLKD